MNDMQQPELKVAELSNDDLFKMVNEGIVDYAKEEITLAYAELDRRGLVQAPTTERAPVVSRLGCLLGVAVFILELAITHQGLFLDKELLPWPRAAALAAFVARISSYWHGKELHKTFWKHCLWTAGLVLLGSLASWDIPNLLRRQQVPGVLAFGIPILLFALFLYWFFEYYLPRSQQDTGRDKE